MKTHPRPELISEITIKSLTAPLLLSPDSREVFPKVIFSLSNKYEAVETCQYFHFKIFNAKFRTFPCRDNHHKITQYFKHVMLLTSPGGNTRVNT